MNDLVSRLQQGKAAMAERCSAIASQYTPDGYTVVYRKSLSGKADYKNKVIYAPKPVTRRALYVFLHECAHVILGHNSRAKPRYVQEYEAEIWAHNTMRENNVPVPRKETRMAKRYVARKIDQALRRGLKSLDTDIARWAAS